MSFGVDTSAYDAIIMKPMLKNIKLNTAYEKLMNVVTQALGKGRKRMTKEERSKAVQWYRTTSTGKEGKTKYVTMLKVPAFTKQEFIGASYTSHREAGDKAAAKAIKILEAAAPAAELERDRWEAQKDKSNLKGKLQEMLQSLLRTAVTPDILTYIRDQVAPGTWEGTLVITGLTQDPLEFEATATTKHMVDRILAKRALEHLELLDRRGHLDHLKNESEKEGGSKWEKLSELVYAKDGDITVEVQEAANAIEAVVKITGLDTPMEFKAAADSRSRATKKAVFTAWKAMTKA